MEPKRILVALNGAATDADVMGLAVSLGKPAKAAIVAVHVIEVRWDQPLDAVMTTELDRGEQILDEAAALAQKAGTKVETELLQAREAAAAIIDTARERNSDLVIVGMPYRRKLGRVYVGKTVQNVYTGAGCAVLAYRQPEPS